MSRPYIFKKKKKSSLILPEIGHLDSSLHHWSQQAAQLTSWEAALCCRYTWSAHSGPTKHMGAVNRHPVVCCAMLLKGEQCGQSWGMLRKHPKPGWQEMVVWLWIVLLLASPVLKCVRWFAACFSALGIGLKNWNSLFINYCAQDLTINHQKGIAAWLLRNSMVLAYKWPFKSLQNILWDFTTIVFCFHFLIQRNPQT